MLASLIGTAIEFYDFYIYGTAAALVIGQTFFPQSAPQTQALNAFLTFGIAFLARPVGAFLFGHFGDRVGRKATLVATMVVMGLSTTLIGVLPGYATAGALAPWLLCLLRFGQGVGLGGEWGGAALLATENAPHGRRAWFGMFPQLGPPIGFLMANGLFLLLILGLGEQSFVAWAWRVPFLLSAALVAIGLYVRVTVAETPAFRALVETRQRARGSARRSDPRSLAAADPGLAGDRRLLRAVLRLDGVRARLRRDDAAYRAHRLPGDAVRGGAVHGGGDAALRRARRPLRPPAGAARRARSSPRRSGSPCRACSSGGTFGVLAFLSLALGVDGPHLRAARRAAAGALPRPRALHRRVERLQSRRHSRRFARADVAQLLLARGGLAWVGYYIVAAAAVSFASLLSVKETRDARADVNFARRPSRYGRRTPRSFSMRRFQRFISSPGRAPWRSSRNSAATMRSVLKWRKS